MICYIILTRNKQRQATGREGKKMENIIREVMCAMEHGIRRDEAINDAANIHAASYDAYCALYNALQAAIPTCREPDGNRPKRPKGRRGKLNPHVAQ